MAATRQPFFIMKYLIALILFSTFFVNAQDTTYMNSFVDDWHLNAADADFENYFGKMDDSFVFLGTAPGERWIKEEFASFSKPYFDAGRAWDFKASNRIWQFAGDSIAWFDEDLDTWMRGCRGSGILMNKEGEWKLMYYNLTVLIENEKIQEFIDLRDAPMPVELEDED